jgi:hypothetical protein
MVVRGSKAFRVCRFAAFVLVAAAWASPAGAVDGLAA